MIGQRSSLEYQPSRPPTDSLIGAYREACPFFFGSVEETLLAQPDHVEAYVARRSDDDLANHVQSLLRGIESRQGGAPRCALALPFTPSELARGFTLRKVERVAGRVPAVFAAERTALEAQSGYAVHMRPTPRAYMDAVAQALALIEAGELEKVVLGRTLTLQFAERVDSAEWLRRFHAQNPSGYLFALDLDAPGQPMHKLMGASPELLLRKRAGLVTTNPLAGSRPRGRGVAEDQDNARALLESEKDHREHALVIQAVEAALRPFCTDMEVPSQPSLLSTPTMWHLSTLISGRLRDPSCSSIALVQALHPTPAVSGYPCARATQLIASLEGFSRGPFAGAVGHCNAQGDGEWAVTLRCAEVSSTTARLFAGAGIVAGSSPRAELEETSAKLRTALRALGVPMLSGAS